MRAVTVYRGVVISTNLAGGYYFRAGTLVCRLSLGEVKASIDRLFL